MAIILNDNLKINAGKPSESKYLSSGNTAYSATTEAISAITISERHLGLTVLVDTGTTNIEYWWREGVQDVDLIEKKFSSEQLVGDFITGATNLGYFEGTDSIQWLDISGTGFGADASTYEGNYYSDYNWYYVDKAPDLGEIKLGSPTHNGPLRRPYINLTRTKSWVWDEGSGEWNIIQGDVTTQVGDIANINTHTGYNFTGITWSGSEGTASASTSAYGSLDTGTTVTIGNPIYRDKSDQDLNLRTPISDTPEFLKIEVDDYYLRFSGVSSVINGSNLGTGAEVFKQKTGSTLQYRTLVGSGDTTIVQTDDEIRIYSVGGTGGTGTMTVDNVGTGGGIVYRDVTGTTINLRTIKGSGSTIVTTVGNEIIIDSSGGTYGLASPSVIPVGGICTGTILTGKTSFELWEELLVPELCGTITAPSIGINLSASGLYEIDCNVSQTVSGTFNRGCINPQYCSISDKRSGLPNAYCFTGTGMPSGLQACTSLTASNNDPSYDVLIGTQSWSVLTRYDAGNPALGSKSTEYCAALVSGCTSASSSSIVGVYPLYGTTSSITVLTKQSLQNMTTGNNVLVSLVPESGGNKQKFEIPCAWLGAPTNRPLVGVCQWNTVSSQWEYPGGSAANSLTIWTPSSAMETVQSNVIGYCQYSYNSVDRSAVCIRLVF